MALTQSSHNHSPSLSSCCVCCIAATSGSNSTRLAIFLLPYFCWMMFSQLRLSVVFQRSTLDLSPLLNSTISSLESLQRESATDFEGKVRQLIDKTTIEVNFLRCNAASTRSDSDEEEIESIQDSCKWAWEVRKSSSSNFPDWSYQRLAWSVFSSRSVSIFDPQGLLGKDSLATEKLDVLLDQYQSLTKGPEGRTGCVDEYNVSFVSFVKDHALLEDMPVYAATCTRVLDQGYMHSAISNGFQTACSCPSPANDYNWLWTLL